MMNINWLGFVSMFLSLVSFYVVYGMAKSWTRKGKVRAVVITALLAVPGASFAAYYAHVIPEWSWYYEFRSVWGTEFLVVFVGVAGAFMASVLPKCLMVLPLYGVVMCSVLPIIKPFIAPIKVTDFASEWDGDVCLQSNPSTCGAAATATILRMYGIEASESEVAAEAHSYGGGTEAWYLARVIRARGVKVDFDIGEGFLPEGGLPAVVGVRIGDTGHFIAVLGLVGERYVVGDPLRGREVMTLDELERRYVFTGFHMRVVE